MSAFANRPADDAMPVAPQPPADGDCCHSGCTFCVQDMYEGELERYRVALAAWQERQAANGVQPPAIDSKTTAE